ncbi:protein piccolo-like isoform X2 [Amphiura filiformis]|uniref:protein piccolo-like isoform X2 n=1 Tax=Amphiura filiformis TaxID=82378 RepID=UPI003B21D82A
MEESARKLEELKAKRKMDTAGGQMSKASTSMDTLDGGADQTPLGDRNSVQYRSLDIDSGGRERQRTAPTRDSSMSMSTGHLVERERRIRMDEQGLILPLEDGSTEDVKPKQERRSRRDMMSDERNIRRTIRSDEYGGRELSPTSYSEFQQREVGTAAPQGKTSFSVRNRARSASPSTRHTVELQTPEQRSLSSDSRREMSPPPSRQFLDTQQQAQEYPYASPSSRESREHYEHGRIVNQPGLDPGEYYPVLPRERVETIRALQAREQVDDPMGRAPDRQQMDLRGQLGPERLGMTDDVLQGHDKTKLSEGHIGRARERSRADSYREPGSEDIRERHGASVRSRSLPRVSTTTRHETRPVYQEDYYYGDQEYKMKASEWTRRADVDSGDEYDERRARAIYQSVPGGSRHLKHGGRHVSRQEYEFPTKRYRLKRDPIDHSARSNGVGMRIVGGKSQPETGQLVAFVADIYEGGVAAKTDGIHKGDQVLEWCGVYLTGKTYEEVQRITQGSEKEIDIVIRCGTNLLDSPRPSRRRRQQQQPEPQPQPQKAAKELPQPAAGREQQVHPSRNGVDPKMLSERLEGISKAQYVYSSPSVAAASDSSTPKRKGRDRTKKISGEIQVQLNFDERNHDLIVTLLRARGLAPKDMNGLADPFVKTCLLPGRGSENKRKTRYVPKTLTPEWNQTVIYRNIHPIELGAKILEITVWDFDRFTFNDFMGQVLLDLSDRQWVDNKPRWFTLQDQPANASHEALSPRMLSPVASTSRLPQGGTTPSPKNHRSKHQGSPRRSRSHMAESGGQSSRSSGYEYSDSDRPSHSSKSSYQEHNEGKTQYTHYPDHPTDFKFDDSSTKPKVPYRSDTGQYPGATTTSYVQETLKPNANTTVKVTVTTKRQNGSRPSSLPRSVSGDRLHHHDSHQSPVSFERGRSTTRSSFPQPGSSRSMSSERVRLSPSNVRKFGTSPSIFNYTSADPGRKKDGSSSGSLSPSPQKTSAPSTLKRATSASPSPSDFKYATLPTSSVDRRGCLSRSGAESDEGPRRREKSSKHVSLSDIEQYDEYTPENVSTTSSLRNGEFPDTGERESPWIKMHLSRPRKSTLSPKTKKKVIKFSTPSLSELGQSQVLDATMPARTESILHRGDYELTGDLLVKLRRRLEDSTGGAETLFVEILRCRRINYNIKSSDNIPDVYVKGYLLRKEKRISKKKTRICKYSGGDPVFNEVFMFNTSGKELSLQLMLWADGGRFGRNSLLGVAIIWLDGIDFIQCEGETGGWYKLFLSKLHPAKNISP